MTGRRRVLVDLGLAVLLLGAMVVELVVSDKPDTGLTPLPLLAVTAAVLPVLWRRRHPALSYGACLLAVGVLTMVTDIYVTIPYASVLTAYTLAVTLGLRAALAAGVVSVPVVLTIIGFASPHGLLNWETPKNLALIALPLVLGVAEHQRRRMHEEETRARVGKERLRIARDVHDVVAHAMVAINVQAGVGAHLLERDPERARGTLLDIKRASGEALGELRSTLGILCDPEDSENAPVQPALSLQELEPLKSSLDRAGLRLVLDVDGSTTGLPASVDATGYRIVREAVTNVLRHASSDEALVRVRRDDERVTIEIEDDGLGRRTPLNGSFPGTGNGLRGMRERADAIGGTLDAGERPEGGWRVAASLPVGTAP